MMTSKKTQLEQHQHTLKNCTQCTNMIRPVITGNAVMSSIMLIGQAPGIHEGEVQKPFGWTAGKTLFKWFESIGLAETEFRQNIYMTAVCRCFPGKNKQGGDRVPSKQEVQQCSHWLNRDFILLNPALVIPVGKLAISQYIKVNKLNEVIGSIHQVQHQDICCDFIPLPHPSGASTWHRTEPGKTLLTKALKLVQQHPAWQQSIK